MTAAESPIKTAVDWNGPFVERDAYGDLTGHQYVECPACGIEVLTDSRSHATHRTGCPHQ